MTSSSHHPRMKPSFIFTLALAAALLPACSVFKKPADVTYDEDMQGTLPIPSFTRQALDGWPEGRKLDPYDSTRVRHPDSVHAYHIGRLPSYDRREMHEAHTVYRVEQNARWDQRLPGTPMESRGVIFGIREPSHNPVPTDQVVANERSRQLKLSADIEDQLATLTAKQKQLDDFLASAPDKTKTIAELTEQRTAAEKEIAKLKADIQQMSGRLKEFEDREAIREQTMKGAKKSSTAKP